MRITHCLSPLGLARAQPPLRAQNLTQIKAHRSRWPAVPAPAFQTELHPPGLLQRLSSLLKRAPEAWEAADLRIPAICKYAARRPKLAGLGREQAPTWCPAHSKCSAKGTFFPARRHFCLLRLSPAFAAATLIQAPGRALAAFLNTNKTSSALHGTHQGAQTPNLLWRPTMPAGPWPCSPFLLRSLTPKHSGLQQHSAHLHLAGPTI